MKFGSLDVLVGITGIVILLSRLKTGPKFRVGDTVRRKSDFLIGTVVAVLLDPGPGIAYDVQFPSGIERVPEFDLELTGSGGSALMQALAR